MYGLLLLLHILAATVWTGGHLVLAFTVLPRVIREGSPAELLRFEAGFEKIGMPALLIQILTGPVLAHRMLPNLLHWFDPANPVARVLMLKLGLLALTAAFAVHARFRVIPRLSERNLTVMAWHIIPVTLFAVLFVVVGVSFRTGWFY